MCEYCGCQDIDVIAALTEEHDAIREVAWRAGRAAAEGDAGIAAIAVDELRRLLRPHTEVEERGLFAEMAAEYPDHVTRLLHDHDAIDALLDEVVAQPRPSDWAARLKEALAMLFEHILREQDGLFPAALLTLTAAAWENVVTVREDVLASRP